MQIRGAMKASANAAHALPFVLAGMLALACGLARGEEQAAARPASRGEASPMMLAQAGPGAAASQPGLDALVNGAKAEGELSFYISLPESTGRRIREAFAAKYGIKTQFVRLVTANLRTRFFAEAAAGTVGADVMIIAADPSPYTIDGVKQGAIEPLSQARLPALTSGEFPAGFNRGGSALVQITPWVISYDTTKLKPEDVPKTWADVLNPKWRGRIITSDPRTGATYAAFWSMIIGKYGESYLKQLAALDPRLAAAGAPAIQALAAGEGVINMPTIVALVQGPKEKGATIGYVVPEVNTGVEASVVLVSRSKSKHPNAGRLFANYVLSREGNTALNADPGGASLYEAGRLPKEYVSPDDSGGSERLAYLAKLLGFK